jgi:hypothetical protein
MSREKHHSVSTRLEKLLEYFFSETQTHERMLGKMHVFSWATTNI